MAQIIGATSGNSENYYVALLSNGAQAERRPRFYKRLNGKLFRIIAVTLLITTLGILITLSSKSLTESKTKQDEASLWAASNAKEGYTSSYAGDFERFIHRFEKIYKSTEEKLLRFEVFLRNMIYIELVNNQDLPYKLAANAFADLTFEEFKVLYFTGYKPTSRFLQGIESVNTNWSLAVEPNIPTAVNWESQGCVTPVKDQGQCGSCWSFSCTGAIEGANCAKHGSLISLSEQQLVDCSNQSGCNGGSMEETFAWLEKSRGLCSEVNYPYRARDGHCHKCLPEVKVTGFHMVPPKNASALQAAIAISPVSVAIEADQKAFQFYSSGVFTSKCGHKLDHGVLAVGYGVDSKTQTPYWMIKNSWGPQWGLKGFIMLDRSVKSAGQCGILLDASYPQVE